MGGQGDPFAAWRTFDLAETTGARDHEAAEALPGAVE
jgi:hypothetical protein